ncbi:MAG: ornithine decarboxylase [Ignavibacteriae bacterium HGW-Ignavibacteriae-4]|nr:MAG: ornithine decarboxylase [Ignavibacteriae bacterium HGW-Ignavibacteriae-4]
MKKNNISRKQFYNISQLRIDYWSRLKVDSHLLKESNTTATSMKLIKTRVSHLIEELTNIESYFALPGTMRLKSISTLFKEGDYNSLSYKISETCKQLVGNKHNLVNDISIEDETELDQLEELEQVVSHRKNHFEVLFIDRVSEQEEIDLKNNYRNISEKSDKFTYNIIFQNSFQDALIALLFNHNIQSVIIRFAPQYFSNRISDEIVPYVKSIEKYDYSKLDEIELGPVLGDLIKKIRPELDVYYVTDTSLSKLKDSTLKCFRRIFYQSEDIQEMHLTLLRGIEERYDTPFFKALVEYSQKPTGVFHAMPISRGNSVFKSNWINDFGEFYGRNLFLAETSATTGGLDSLLMPTGPLKRAQEKARDAYGSLNTYFVTNGTSTANKIVLQALVKPKDVVLIDRDCHKSHHYGLVLAGAYPVYLDSYPIQEYSMYGAVPIDHIVNKLLKLKESGRLDKVKMLLLTNCTFDGIVYNVEKVMQRVLAIKPDMIFLWDEAWFAFAGFGVNHKQRTAMYTAKRLSVRYKSEEYKLKYEQHIAELKKGETPSLPDPKLVRVRVYATQSTHKTLSSFRQGSMIHIWDEDFRRKSESTFLEAYMTHTSTSPNYQMLASLDIGRRQVQLEGFELVENSIEMAMLLREKIVNSPQLSKYFDVLTVFNFIPDERRESGLQEYYTKELGWNLMEDAWRDDEFVLDPTKITLCIGKTGVDGDTFKNKYLMDKFGIQINKTSRNTVLFMTNIGTTKGSVSYLIKALLNISEELDDELKSLNDKELEIHEKRICSLMKDVPPLPDFSYFHHSFQAVPGVPGGDIRTAYYLAYNEKNYEYILLEDCLEAMKAGRILVASTFLIPYPPGFPVLVPGQVISEEIINFMLALDVSEVHGYNSNLGMRIFKEKVLRRDQINSSIGGISTIK